MSKSQSYNGRSKKWVLFVDGQIKKMSDSKFSGVPVKGKKSTGKKPRKKKGVSVGKRPGKNRFRMFP